MSKKITITLKGKYVQKLEEIREKTGLPVSQMVGLVIKGYTIVEINTGKDLLDELRKQINREKNITTIINNTTETLEKIIKK